MTEKLGKEELLAYLKRFGDTYIPNAPDDEMQEEAEQAYTQIKKLIEKYSKYEDPQLKDLNKDYAIGIEQGKFDARMERLIEDSEQPRKRVSLEDFTNAWKKHYPYECTWDVLDLLRKLNVIAELVEDETKDNV